MPRRRQSVAPQTTFEVTMERITAAEKAIRIIKQSRMAGVQVVDILNFNDASEGMICIDWPTYRYCWYHDGEWICVPPDPTHAIKIFSDTRINRVRNGAFRFSIGHDLDDHILVYAEGGNGTAGAGATTIQISNQTRGLDMLTVPITIPSGARVSSVPATINKAGDVYDPNHRVNHKDIIWCDVDSVGAASKGAYVFLTFAQFPDSRWIDQMVEEGGFSW